MAIHKRHLVERRDVSAIGEELKLHPTFLYERIIGPARRRALPCAVFRRSWAQFALRPSHHHAPALVCSGSAGSPNFNRELLAFYGGAPSDG